MNPNLTPFNLYHKYRQEKCSPFLLESCGPQTSYSSRSVLGVKPGRKLVCVNGELFENGCKIGNALDIFKHLALSPQERFFPAWMGFFAYEFGRHFGLPTKAAAEGLPEAVFYYFDDGFVWDGDRLVESPQNISVMPAQAGIQGTTSDQAEASIVEQQCSALDASLRWHDNKNSCDLIASPDNESFFASAFSKVANSIADGDVYQVNIAQRYSFDATQIDFCELYERLRLNNPSPFMGLIEDEDWAIACASPERLFRLHKGTISSRPIAGTRKRGATENEDLALESDLLSSAKERAEHAMLVDLVRNDLARVCDTGTVHVDEGYIVERYSHVMHLVSEVSGRSSASLQQIFASLFPAGTITGTPKESAMEHIRDLEPFVRGPYTGSLGYVSGGAGADFNILIRSAYRDHERGHIWAGAGIVAQSNAPSERNEVSSKAQSVSHVLRNAKSPSAPALPRLGEFFERPVRAKAYGRRVLFVENHDSFSHNIIDAIRRLGHLVDVVDHDQTPNFAHYRHVILGPGPKRPNEAGKLMMWVSEAVQNECAILGICLGHQALGLQFGAKIIKARRAIHGETDQLTHLQHPLFDGVPTNFKAMRYHSLVITQIPSCFQVTAYSASDEVMAIAHKQQPLYGVQFHPESFLSEGGDRIFANFFELNP